MLQNAYLDVKIGVDTAEIQPGEGGILTVFGHIGQQRLGGRRTADSERNLRAMSFSDLAPTTANGCKISGGKESAFGATNTTPGAR